MKSVFVRYSSVQKKVILDPNNTAKKIIIESALPGNTNHYIKKITIPEISDFKNFLGYFSAMSNPELECKEQKTYLIDTLACAKSAKTAHSVMVINRSAALSFDIETYSLWKIENTMYFETEGKQYLARMIFNKNYELDSKRTYTISSKTIN